MSLIFLSISVASLLEGDGVAELGSTLTSPSGFSFALAAVNILQSAGMAKQANGKEAIPAKG